jgi:DNA (cytosine-5)-methyltransferase 1
MGIKMSNQLTAIELFAGVGGFRLGIEPYFKVIWSNQWEPKSKKQWASDVYIKHFGKDNHINKNISTINTNDIPNADLLVGGFPCQDYSVATSNAKGIMGKKGVLWWEIYRILKEKAENRPKYLILENVDRLLKSPTNQKGRDFAIILYTLSELGYAVEWKVINAADYGFPQKRRRIFIVAYLKNTVIYNEIINNIFLEWFKKNSIMNNAFPIIYQDEKRISFNNFFDVHTLSEHFNKDNIKDVFYNSGIIIEKEILTVKSAPIYNDKKTLLQDIIVNENNVPEEFYIKENDMEKWRSLKGSEKKERMTKSGHKYIYSQGAVPFPDHLYKPGRTIITSEGGSSPSRFKHVIEINNKYRRLMPIELERMNGFLDNYTLIDNITPIKRAFLMGNALVVGIVKKLAENLYNKINEEKIK